MMKSHIGVPERPKRLQIVSKDMLDGRDAMPDVKV